MQIMTYTSNRILPITEYTWIIVWSYKHKCRWWRNARGEHSHRLWTDKSVYKLEQILQSQNRGLLLRIRLCWFIPISIWLRCLHDVRFFFFFRLNQITSFNMHANTLIASELVQGGSHTLRTHCICAGSQQPAGAVKTFAKDHQHLV